MLKNILENLKQVGLSQHLYRAMQKAAVLVKTGSVPIFIGGTLAFQILGFNNIERAQTEVIFLLSWMSELSPLRECETRLPD